MRNMIVLCLSLAAMPARAQIANKLATAVSEVCVSSATSARITVSTSTAARIDNAGADGLMSDRTNLRICNEDSTVKIRFAFDTAVSTTSTSARYGESVNPGTCKNINVSGLILVAALSEASSSAPVVIVTQCR